MGYKPISEELKEGTTLELEIVGMVHILSQEFKN